MKVSSAHKIDEKLRSVGIGHAEIHEIGPVARRCFCRAFGETCRRTAKSRRDETQTFRGLGAILFKEFIVVWRDPMTLFFMFFPPLIEMVAFGYALDTDVKHMAMVIYNEDRTVESRQLIDRFVNTETFRVVGEVQSVDATRRAKFAKVALTSGCKFRRRSRVMCAPAIQPRCSCWWTVRTPTTALQALNTG